MLALVSLEAIGEEGVEIGAHHADVVEPFEPSSKKVRPNISAEFCA
jgi:hypothetical protein